MQSVRHYHSLPVETPKCIDAFIDYFVDDISLHLEP